MKSNIWVSKEHGVTHVNCMVSDGGEQETLDFAKQVLELFAGDKETWMRDEPWMKMDKDYDTKIFRVQGGVRFAFVNQPGPRHPPKSVIVGFGDAV